MQGPPHGSEITGACIRPQRKTLNVQYSHLECRVVAVPCPRRRSRGRGFKAALGTLGGELGSTILRPVLPRPSVALTHEDQTAMLDAALGAMPETKGQAGADYVFLMLFEQRQGALAFIAVTVGVFYGLTLPVADRHALHLVFGVMAALFTLVNANHAGLPFLGHHPKISRNGRNVGLVFAPFWAVATVLNYLAFTSAT